VHVKGGKPRLDRERQGAVGPQLGLQTSPRGGGAPL